MHPTAGLGSYVFVLLSLSFVLMFTVFLNGLRVWNLLTVMILSVTLGEILGKGLLGVSGQAWQTQLLWLVALLSASFTGGLLGRVAGRVVEARMSRNDEHG